MNPVSPEWVGAPNERPPFSVHDAAIGFVDQCLTGAPYVQELPANNFLQDAVWPISTFLVGSYQPDARPKPHPTPKLGVFPQMIGRPKAQSRPIRLSTCRKFFAGTRDPTKRAGPKCRGVHYAWKRFLETNHLNQKTKPHSCGVHIPGDTPRMNRCEW